MLIYPTDDMESMVELMVVYVGRDVCGGRWAGLVVRGFVLNVPICNRSYSVSRDVVSRDATSPHIPRRLSIFILRSRHVKKSY
jgi:hypothetical protein